MDLNENNNIYNLYIESKQQPVMTIDVLGTKHWKLNSKLHREDGPAIEEANGNKYWYLNDIELTKEAFNEYIKAKQFNKELVLKENTIFSQDFLDELIL
jgi:hypothetical protein